jgi:hypothetical protein
MSAVVDPVSGGAYELGRKGMDGAVSGEWRRVSWMEKWGWSGRNGDGVRESAGRICVEG